jgi:hypothetical protein
MDKATQLTQASGRLMRGSSLIDLQAGSCGSSKYMMLIYLTKKNVNENIQTVSGEDKWEDNESCNILR